MLVAVVQVHSLLTGSLQHTNQWQPASARYSDLRVGIFEFEPPLNLFCGFEFEGAKCVGAGPGRQQQLGLSPATLELQTKVHTKVRNHEKAATR